MIGTAFFKGMGLGAGLIVAIGTQNAFLLRQGLRRQYVMTATCICIACDLLLIVAGVVGVGHVITDHPLLLVGIKASATVFLLGYGLRAAWSAYKPGELDNTVVGEPLSRSKVITTALVFSLLNPHAFLDTVILLGSIGGQQPGAGPYHFAAGAMLASAIWFFSLGFGARLLVPIFSNPLAWRLLDGSIALVMWVIAVSMYW